MARRAASRVDQRLVGDGLIEPSAKTSTFEMAAPNFSCCGRSRRRRVIINRCAGPPQGTTSAISNFEAAKNELCAFYRQPTVGKPT